MTKVQMAPGIPKEKSRTVRPVHGPATIHLLWSAIIVTTAGYKREAISQEIGS